MRPALTMLRCAPNAFPRSLSGKTEMIMAMPVPWIMAEPTPCSTLAPISVSMLPAAAARPDATTKIPMPET